MTYKLWKDAVESGPFDRDNIAERHWRGELTGYYWRRTGTSEYRPNSELSLELASTEPASGGPPPTTPLVTEPVNLSTAMPAAAPDGTSTLGYILHVLSFLGLCGGLLGVVAGSRDAGTLIGTSVTGFVIGLLCHILAVLRQISHRLRK